MNATKIDDHDDDRQRCFDIQGSLPKTGADHWRRNIALIIIASTARRAIELAEEKHPGIAVWSLSHRGDYKYHQVIIDRAGNSDDRWIPVSERLPEQNELVWAWTVQGYSITARLSKLGKWFDLAGDERNVTYWRPLPPAPGKEGVC